MRELDPGQLGRLDRFNGGGQATIYRAPDLSLPGESGPFVYKAYNDRTIHGKREAMRNSLRSLIRVRSEAADEDRRVIDARCVWPLAVVADGRGATGCIMREVPDVFFRRITYSTGRVRLKPWSWEFHLQDPQEVADRGLPNLKDADVAFLLARALRFLATVHRLDVIVGDLSSANILIDGLWHAKEEQANVRRCRYLPNSTRSVGIGTATHAGMVDAREPSEPGALEGVGATGSRSPRDRHRQSQDENTRQAK